MMPRRIRGVVPGYLHAAAGSSRAAPAFAPLRRPPSPPIGAFRRIVDVPIGNDGVAFPGVFTGAGNAQVFAGPAGIGTSWEPSQAFVYTSVGPNDPALAAVFVGPLPIAQYQVASFLAGGGAQVPLGGIQMVPGWFIWALWTGGTPGATAFLNVSGAKKALVI